MKVLKTILAYMMVMLVALLAAIGQAVLTAQPSDARKTDAPAPAAGTATNSIITRVPPVIANLKLPEGMWVRLDTVIVSSQLDAQEAALLTSQFGQDTLQYMQTLSLNDLEGSQALTNLRQDLLERVQSRSNGRVKELIITSLVVQ
jgi:flagellar FliL protein